MDKITAFSRNFQLRLGGSLKVRISQSSCSFAGVLIAVAWDRLMSRCDRASDGQRGPLEGGEADTGIRVWPCRQSALAAKARYQAVAAKTGVPWFVIAVIHQRESSQNFSVP